MIHMTEALNMTAPPPTWHLMRFHAPDGRDELLWVESRGGGRYAVLSVPIWVYGVSPGTIVEGRGSDDQLEVVRIVANSPGATVRYVVSPEVTASVIYLSRILEDAKRFGFLIGPATFLNPRLCAFHVRRRGDWWPTIGSYLENLVTDGIISQWEVGDPDEYGSDGGSSEDPDVTPSELRHPLPVDGADGSYIVD
jgi:hypothetical protein